MGFMLAMCLSSLPGREAHVIITIIIVYHLPASLEPVLMLSLSQEKAFCQLPGFTYLVWGDESAKRYI